MNETESPGIERLKAVIAAAEAKQRELTRDGRYHHNTEAQRIVSTELAGKCAEIVAVTAGKLAALHRAQGTEAEVLAAAQQRAVAGAPAATQRAIDLDRAVQERRYIGTLLTAESHSRFGGTSRLIPVRPSEGYLRDVWNDA